MSSINISLSRDLRARTLTCFYERIFKFSAITNSHLFPDEGSIAEMSEFYLQLATFNLPPSLFHTQTLRRNPRVFCFAQTKELKSPLLRGAARQGPRVGYFLNDYYRYSVKIVCILGLLFMSGVNFSFICIYFEKPIHFAFINQSF